MFLECRNVRFGYNKPADVLKGISFVLEKGESLSIVGASGCGKSTLLRILSGILPELTSQFLSGEVEINNLNQNDYRKTGKLSFMFQEPTLLPNLSVFENINMPLELKGQQNPKNTEDLIQMVGLGDYRNYYPKQLSGGMKTRVALARSFITSPELLLLDEPFSALDIAWKSTLYKELEKLSTKFNTTVLIVTHDVQEALLLSNNVLVLNSLGEIESFYKLPPTPIAARLEGIAEFMKEVYENLMLPIQDSIINGKNKRNETLDPVYMP